MNLRSAVLTSLFLLPERFSKEDLFMQIAGLSYTGDPRMIVGEDKGKVKNIVSPNIEKFIDLYSPVLKNLPNITIDSTNVQQDKNPEVLYHNLQRLPTNLHGIVRRNLNLDKQREDALKKKFDEFSNDELKDVLSKSIAQIVRRSSTTQTLKNSLTAGVRKSFYYSGEKLRKMFRGLIR